MHDLKRGFQFTTIHVDVEFAPFQALVQEMPGGAIVNLASASKHVSEIERHIRVAKERIRSTRHSITFNNVTKLFMIHLVFGAIKMLNHFPVKWGISDTISPKTIMT